MPQNTDHDDAEPRSAQLDALSPEVAPPPALEERVVAALRAEGLVGSRGAAHGFTFRRAAMAAGLLLVSVLGFAGGRLTAPAAEAPSPDYVLLLLSGPGGEEAVPGGEMMRRVQEYTDWYVENLERGVMVAGEKLTNEVPRVLTAGESGELRVDAGQVAVGDAGFLEGFFLIRAPEDAAAQRIAAGCPHLKYGGVIEVRRIDKFQEGS
jgi:hypothetical protein